MPAKHPLSWQPKPWAKAALLLLPLACIACRYEREVRGGARSVLHRMLEDDMRPGAAMVLVLAEAPAPVSRHHHHHHHLLHGMAPSACMQGQGTRHRYTCSSEARQSPAAGVLHLNAKLAGILASILLPPPPSSSLVRHAQGSTSAEAENIRVQVTDGWYTCPALLHTPLTLQLLARNAPNLLQVRLACQSVIMCDVGV